MSLAAQCGSMDESTLTERLDERGLLADAHEPGCYALRVETPDTEIEVAKQWRQHHVNKPPDGVIERLADAERVAYVGASGDIYQRLCDHVGGEVRRATFLSIFPPREVVEIGPCEDPFDAEFNRAMRLVSDGWTVWTDGELLG